MRAVPRVYRLAVGYELFRDLTRAREFIRDHCAERIMLEQAAAEAFLSPFHFQRTFSAAFGESPHEYLTRLRPDRAKLLLRQQSLTVSDVCLEVGFQSLGSFSTLFSRLEGCSPKEFRRVYSTPDLWTLKVAPACLLRFSSV